MADVHDMDTIITSANFVALIILVICSIQDAIKKEVWSMWILIMGACALVVVVMQIIKGNYSILGGIYSAFPGAIALLFIMLGRDYIGRADALVMLFIGVQFGLMTVLFVITIAFILLFIVVVVLLIFKQIDMRSYIPFVPFLAVGMFVSELMVGKII